MNASELSKEEEEIVQTFRALCSDKGSAPTWEGLASFARRKAKIAAEAFEVRRRYPYSLHLHLYDSALIERIAKLAKRNDISQEAQVCRLVHRGVELAEQDN